MPGWSLSGLHSRMLSGPAAALLSLVILQIHVFLHFSWDPPAPLPEVPEQVDEPAVDDRKLDNCSYTPQEAADCDTGGLEWVVRVTWLISGILLGLLFGTNGGQASAIAGGRAQEIPRTFGSRSAIPFSRPRRR